MSGGECKLDCGLLIYWRRRKKGETLGASRRRQQTTFLCIIRVACRRIKPLLMKKANAYSTAQTGPSPPGQDAAVATRIADIRRACEVNGLAANGPV
jgi:hypothetical protein